jgi:hypothetical protein
MQNTIVAHGLNHSIITEGRIVTAAGALFALP